MIVVSFDIGMRNLAYSVASVSEEKAIILAWNLKDFGPKATLNELVPIVITWLRDTFLMQWDTVLIENQVGTKMKAIQTIIAAYFHATKNRNGQLVINMSPKVKLMGVDCADTYAARKKASIDIVTDKVFGNDQNVAYKEWFMSLKKKDDVCDALLQCINYCKTKRLLNWDFVCDVDLGEVC